PRPEADDTRGSRGAGECSAGAGRPGLAGRPRGGRAFGTSPAHGAHAAAPERVAGIGFGPCVVTTFTTKMNRFFITTPIYYVNDVPHIGHAYTTVAADVLARWNRGHEAEVFFLTGTDEHGTKIAQAAAAHNKDPQQYCDEISAQFAATWKSLKISNDAFIRTTSVAHQNAV